MEVPLIILINMCFLALSPVIIFPLPQYTNAPYPTIDLHSSTVDDHVACSSPPPFKADAVPSTTFAWNPDYDDTISQEPTTIPHFLVSEQADPVDSPLGTTSKTALSHSTDSSNELDHPTSVVNLGQTDMPSSPMSSSLIPGTTRTTTTTETTEILPTGTSSEASTVYGSSIMVHTSEIHRAEITSDTTDAARTTSTVHGITKTTAAPGVLPYTGTVHPLPRTESDSVHTTSSEKPTVAMISTDEVQQGSSAQSDTQTDHAQLKTTSGIVKDNEFTSSSSSNSILDMTSARSIDGTDNGSDLSTKKMTEKAMITNLDNVIASSVSIPSTTMSTVISTTGKLFNEVETATEVRRESTKTNGHSESRTSQNNHIVTTRSDQLEMGGTTKSIDNDSPSTITTVPMIPSDSSMIASRATIAASPGTAQPVSLPSSTSMVQETTSPEWTITTTSSTSKITTHLGDNAGMTDPAISPTTDKSPSESPHTTTSISLTSSTSETRTSPLSTAPNQPIEVCPELWTEGKAACFLLQSIGSSYSIGISYCQATDRSDMISREDIFEEHEAIRAIMIDFNLDILKSYVNAYWNPQIRKNQTVGIVRIHASTPLLTANLSIVHRSDKVPDVATFCRLPKNGLLADCPVARALAEAPDMTFANETIPAFIPYGQKMQYRCKDQSVSTRTWEGECNNRGVIYPVASLFNKDCHVSSKPPPPRDVIAAHEKWDPNLKCTSCVWHGTEKCVEGENGQPDTCVCKAGWSMQTCWRFPKFCPTMDCPLESHCVEQADHAVCTCDTEMCVVRMRTENRTSGEQFWEKAAWKGGPTIDFIVRLAAILLIGVISMDRGKTVQDSIQYQKSAFASVSSLVFIFAGVPQTMDIDIAARRAFSLIFHVVHLFVHSLYALEVFHISECMEGRSDNKFKERKERNRWDYGNTYVPVFVLGTAYTLTVFTQQWETQQTEYSGVGIVDIDNIGCLGWMIMAWGLCALYSSGTCYGIWLNKKNNLLNEARRDHLYQFSRNPKNVEESDQVWRNLMICMVGAPLQFFYSATLVCSLVWDSQILKNLNIVFLVFNSGINIIQMVVCDRSKLALLMKWYLMWYHPLEDRFNEYSYLTTAEHLAKRSRRLYEENLKKKQEIEDAKQAEELEEIKKRIEQFESMGIPSRFRPHLPLKGPKKMQKFRYSPWKKDSLTEREREWKFCQWTMTYYQARIKVTVSVMDAIEFVRNRLLDNGFLSGHDCPKKQARTMFREWKEMIIKSDKMEFVKRNAAEQEDYDQIPAKFFNDMQNLSVDCRVQEAMVDKKKKRLLTPIMAMYAPAALPDKEETGNGLWADLHGFIWQRRVIKGLPVITRNQEQIVFEAYLKDEAKHNKIRDNIYDDDERFNELTKLEDTETEPQPWEADVRREYKVKNAFPEGPKATHSINPRKHAVDYSDYRQNRPDFFGPKEPQFCIPCGPLMRRFWLENHYGGRRELIFRILSEQQEIRSHVAFSQNVIIRLLSVKKDWDRSKKRLHIDNCLSRK